MSRVRLPPDSPRQTSDHATRLDKLERRKPFDSGKTTIDPDGTVHWSSDPFTDFSAGPPFVIAHDLNASGHLSGEWSVTAVVQLTAEAWDPMVATLACRIAGFGQTTTGFFWQPSGGEFVVEANAARDPVPASSLVVEATFQNSEALDDVEGLVMGLQIDARRHAS